MPLPKDPLLAEIFKNKIGESIKRRYSCPESKKILSNAQKKRFEDINERRLISERQKVRFEKPEARKKMSEAIKISHSSPDVRHKMSVSHKKRFEDLNTRKKQSNILKNFHASHPEARQNLSKSIKKHYEDLQWYGSVKHYDTPQYCEKWTPELRERVRAWFGYCCVECGTPQTEKKLAIHHVWYNKKMCCDNTPRSLIALCRSCHGKTNVNNKQMRAEFSKYYQTLIDTYYCGRCWLTRDEMACLYGCKDL
jgi:hypothetical protein